MVETAVVQKTELLQVADAVAREKSIDREQVLEAMEQAIQKAGRSKYGQEHDIRAVIDRKSGEISLARYIEVVDEVENEVTQLTLEQAHTGNRTSWLGSSSWTLCRRSISGALRPRQRNRLLSKKYAKPSVSDSMRNTRTAPVRW